MRYRLIFACALVLTMACGALSSSAAAADRPVLMIVGAGYTYNWDTEVVVTNPFGSELRVTVNPVNLSTNGGACSIDPCPPPGPAVLTLPAFGQGTFHFSDLRAIGVSAVYLSVDPGEGLPVARARAYEVDMPTRAMGLPIVSAATLASRPAGPFVFPGAARSASAHSNLVVVETSDLPGANASVLIEAVNGGGERIASTSRSLGSGQSVMIPDLLGVMGLSDFDGSIRVTQTSGSGIINGALATPTADGGFAVSEGFNP